MQTDQIELQHYIDGHARTGTSGRSMDVINPWTTTTAAVVPLASSVEVEDAVGAARRAFELWSQSEPAVRRGYLVKIMEALEGRREEIAQAISTEMGAPIAFARSVQAGYPILDFDVAIEMLDTQAVGGTLGTSEIVKEPIGVVGVITPWNYPLHQICAKVAPAIGAGCTVVVKPSEVAPLSSALFVDILRTAGLPAGVVNVVHGTGESVGEQIAGHPGIDMVTFTGSTGAGRRVSELAARNIKRVVLELGGKSANIILDDADMEVAVTRGVDECFDNSGQSCAAWSRMLVPRDRLDEVEELAARAAGRHVYGDPAVEQTTIGPLVSETQLERVLGYIKQGISDGARIVHGGSDSPVGDQGYFAEPTIFSDVDPEMSIAKNEIFGPVLSIMPYDSEEDAIAKANDSVYGLSGAVWSRDTEHAKSVALRLRTGSVSINGGGFDRLTPFGGYKQSGNGREYGPYGFDEYLEVKALLW